MDAKSLASDCRFGHGYGLVWKAIIALLHGIFSHHEQDGTGPVKSSHAVTVHDTTSPMQKAPSHLVPPPRTPTHSTTKPP